MNRRSALVSIVLATLALAACVGLVGWRLALDPWAEAAEHVRAHAEQRELVVLTPAHHFTDLGSFDGLMAVATDRLSMRDARRFDGIWVVAGGPLKPSLDRALSRLGEPERSVVDGLEVLHYRGGESR